MVNKKFGLLGILCAMSSFLWCSEPEDSVERSIKNIQKNNAFVAQKASEHDIELDAQQKDIDNINNIKSLMARLQQELAATKMQQDETRERYEKEKRELEALDAKVTEQTQEITRLNSNN